jgi:hypothetical protein
MDRWKTKIEGQKGKEKEKEVNYVFDRLPADNTSILSLVRSSHAAFWL